MIPVDRWSRVLLIIGYLAMLIGALDPLEGSLLILPGSGLVAVGTFLRHGEPRLKIYRLSVFFMILIGVSALWGLTMAGGLGGSSGLSIWWALLVLPYLIGWCMGIWGADSPRWLLWLGLGVGFWYLAMPFLIRYWPNEPPSGMYVINFTLGLIGALTIGGCIFRLRTKEREAKE